MGEGGEVLDWGALVALVIHPTKVQILETMAWMGRPLSASELEKVFAGRLGISTISYHLNTLAGFGVLTQVEKERVRGTWKRLYVLSAAITT